MFCLRSARLEHQHYTKAVCLRLLGAETDGAFSVRGMATQIDFCVRRNQKLKRTRLALWECKANMLPASIVPVLLRIMLAAEIAGQPMPVWAANPSHWAYDPSKCLQDAAGKRYIAIGTTVLAINPDPSFVDGTAIELEKSRRLMPPDSTDELGCPDNPNQVLIKLSLKSIFPTSSTVSQALGVGLSGFGLAPMHGVGVSALDGKPIIPDRPSPFRDDPGITDGICKRPDASVTEEDGIETCRWPSYYLEPGTAFVVDPKIYPTPAGDPFRMTCGVQAYDRRMTPCHVASYATATGLAIGYDFFPLVSIRTPDLIKRVINFDYQIRNALSAAVINNYSWRTTP